ncbi:hypothetical protein EVG20_g11089, partial [Dentipellis fragilis]
MSEHDATHVVGLDDDDDGMPPLVERPPTMTFTFCTDLAPIDFSNDSTRFELVPDEDAPRICAPPPGYEQEPEHEFAQDADAAAGVPRQEARRVVHPAPAQRIHPLPLVLHPQPADPGQDRRQPLLALQDHRRCPVRSASTGRSRPSRRRPSTVSATRTGASGPARTRSPSPRSKDGPRKRTPRKKGARAGAGGTVMQPKDRGRERRCAKIAGLLAEGKTGTALATAVQAWEVASGVKEGGNGNVDMSTKAAEADWAQQATQARAEVAMATRCRMQDMATGKARSASPVRFTVPLTAMFKRSSSAPLASGRVDIDIPASPHHNDHDRDRDRDRVTAGPGSPYAHFEMLPQPALSPAPSDASAMSFVPSAFGWPNVSVVLFTSGATGYANPWLTTIIRCAQNHGYARGAHVVGTGGGQEPVLPSPPGSPYSVGTADTELCASPIDISSPQVPMPAPMSSQGYYSSYSSLYGWAGDGNASPLFDADAVFAGHTDARADAGTTPSVFTHGYDLGGAQKGFDFDFDARCGYGDAYGYGYACAARAPAIYAGPDVYNNKDRDAGAYPLGAAQAPLAPAYEAPQGL